MSRPPRIPVVLEPGSPAPKRKVNADRVCRTCHSVVPEYVRVDDCPRCRARRADGPRRCRCREPLPARKYLSRWICGKCGEVVRCRAA